MTELSRAARLRLVLILGDMQQASDVVDAAYGTSENQMALIALALIARHLLRECGDDLLAICGEPPAADAVDPHAANTGTPTPRDKDSSS
jgi:hypothetical protein